MPKKAGKKTATPKAQHDATPPPVEGKLGTGLTPGNASKDKNYLKKIINAIEGDGSHPRNMGIAMQAHHVISGDGMKMAEICSDVEATGYNINHLNNLAFIPCTLEGACFLGIQPHRGNHTADGEALRPGISEQEDELDYYDDECHGKGYHRKVAQELQKFVRLHTLACTGDSNANAEKAVKGLDAVSRSILDNIMDKPSMWKLTSIAQHFGRGGKGCGGVKSVVGYDKLAVTCPSGRVHDFYNKKKVHVLPSSQYRLKFETKKGRI